MKRTLPLLFLALSSSVVAAQQATSPSATPPTPQALSVPAGCKPDDAPASQADTALYLEDYGKAARLYHSLSEEDPRNLTAQAGLIRVLLGQGRIKDALQEATALVVAHPDSVVAETVLGETYLRRGEFALAPAVLAKALTMDRCYGRAHLQEARLLSYSGYHASAVRQLAQAHALSPNDEQVNVAWMFSLPPDQRFALLKAYIASGKFLNDEDREDMRSAVLEGEARAASPCTVSSPPGGTSLKLDKAPVLGPVGGAISVETVINGEKHRLDMDTTGADITISYAAAKHMGLKPVVHVTYDLLFTGGRLQYSLIQVPSIKIGEVEYKNCLIDVVDETYSRFLNQDETDGYIGAGFFSDFLVRVDLPRQQLTLSPLPVLAHNDDGAGLHLWSQAGLDTREVPSMNGGKWGQYNGTSPPEFAGATHFFRFKDDILIPTRFGPGTERLFYLDIALLTPRISTSAAGDISQLDAAGMKNPNVKYRGYFMAFGGMILPIDAWNDADFTRISHKRNLEISGTISRQALQQFPFTVDFRDHLILFDRNAKP
jgi:tetratricopeptide (TPR) repeat protein